MTIEQDIRKKWEKLGFSPQQIEESIEFIRSHKDLGEKWLSSKSEHPSSTKKIYDK